MPGLPLDLIAELLHINAEVAYLVLGPRSPYLTQDVSAREHPTCGTSKNGEQAVFRPSQVDVHSGNTYSSLIEVYTEVSDRKNVGVRRGVSRSRCPQCDSNSGQELRCRERLGDEVVRTCVERVHPTLLLTASRDYDDGNVAILANSSSDVPSVKIRKTQVEQNDTGLSPKRGDDSVGSIGHLNTMIATLS